MAMNDIMMETIQIINKAHDAGISTRRLCKEAGIREITVARWKKGKNTPVYNKFKDFQDAFIRLADNNNKIDNVA